VSQDNSFLKKTVRRLAVVGGVACYLYYENYTLGTTDYIVRSPKYQGL